jgi:DNA-binding NarL/FixJ family response regulator
VRRRRKKPLKPGPTRGASSKLRVERAKKEFIDLVRTGIEGFILKNATVEDFLRTIRGVAEEEEIYAHQLTSSVLSAIVKDALRKRHHRQSK